MHSEIDCFKIDVEGTERTRNTRCHRIGTLEANSVCLHGELQLQSFPARELP